MQPSVPTQAQPQSVVSFRSKFQLQTMEARALMPLFDQSQVTDPADVSLTARQTQATEGTKRNGSVQDQQFQMLSAVNSAQAEDGDPGRAQLTQPTTLERETRDESGASDECVASIL